MTLSRELDDTALLDLAHKHRNVWLGRMPSGRVGWHARVSIRRSGSMVIWRWPSADTVFVGVCILIVSGMIAWLLITGGGGAGVIKVLALPTIVLCLPLAYRLWLYPVRLLEAAPASRGLSSIKDIRDRPRVSRVELVGHRDARYVLALRMRKNDVCVYHGTTREQCDAAFERLHRLLGNEWLRDEWEVAPVIRE